MTASVEERTAVNEQAIKDIRDDVKDIKASIKELERLAQRGNGMLRAAWAIGSAVGWIIGLVMTVISVFKAMHH